ncbi:hypothetical protein [Glutamicibacter sp. FBE19]|uniref:hypothetical protein n=1 Tax=Glutamicibacter sp. FBE19 TaxID=2761534 RepID=UPI0018965A52|nr:hypothetical protein [Glutamicibacter sp. FBE19]MBF6671552.1 hypothetical protein [Glutamicibacter sp. FBE19]
MTRIYFIPVGKAPEPPTTAELADAVDLTDYVTTTGVEVTPDDVLRTQVRRIADQLRIIGLTAEDLGKLAQAFATETKTETTTRRQMNTNMKYPTSTPPWARRRK